MQERRSYGFNTQNTILGIAIMVLGLVALFWLAKSVFTILTWVAPILLIATLVINHKVVINYGKWIWNLLKTNTIVGIVATLLTIIGFPVVSLLLFGRAMLGRKVEQMTGTFRQEEQTYTDYEVVDEDMEILELPPMEPPPIQTEDTDYEELFD
ncbi:MAG: hypothetical protein KTR24_12495 [Saprospiraceae bacterium]|nr:hypothetical protein [Saprospiraceae bacterium]